MFKTSELSFVFMGIVLLFLIVIFVMLVPANRFGSNSKRIKRLETKVTQMTDELVRFENIEKRLIRIESHEQKDSNRLDRLESSIPLKIAHIANQLDKLEKQTVQTASKKTAELKTAENVKKKAEVLYHQVQAGETLFNIGLRYGLTVDDLRRLNNIGSKEETIHIGQKLLISP